MYPTTVMKNTATGRFHPISYRPAPRPSESADLGAGTVCRHKSIGHHTDGFDTLEEAVEWIEKNEGARYVDTLEGWDGEPGTAHNVSYFPL